MSGPVRLEWAHGDAVARVILARPRANVMDSAMIDAIRSTLAEIGARPDLKLIVFEGDGPNFSFGAAVGEHLPGEVEHMLPKFHALFYELEELGVPTAAVVRGHCLGGAAELVTVCGYVAAAPGAHIGFPEVTLGVFPPVAAVALRWRTGGAVATRMVVTGDPVTAEVAARHGLVDEIADDPRDAVDRWYSAHLGGLSAVGLRYAWRASRAPFLAALRDELPKLESLYLDDLMKCADPVEGLRAFMDRRQPEWRHA